MSARSKVIVTIRTNHGTFEGSSLASVVRREYSHRAAYVPAKPSRGSAVVGHIIRKADQVELARVFWIKEEDKSNGTKD